jgi:hypothetical protein
VSERCFSQHYFSLLLLRPCCHFALEYDDERWSIYVHRKNLLESSYWKKCTLWAHWVVKWYTGVHTERSCKFCITVKYYLPCFALAYPLNMHSCWIPFTQLPNTLSYHIPLVSSPIAHTILFIRFLITVLNLQFSLFKWVWYLQRNLQKSLPWVRELEIHSECDLAVPKAKLYPE